MRKVLLPALVLVTSLGWAQAKKPDITAIPPSVPVVTKPQTPPPDPYVPTEIQLLSLQNHQLKMTMAQNNLNFAATKLPEFQQFQDERTALANDCGRVIKENNWLAGTTCDINSLKFTPPAPAPAPQAPAKAPEKPLETKKP